MKFLIRSGCGESLPVALRLKQEGNEVRFAISEEADKEYHLIGDGMIDKSTLPRSMDWADVIVFDSNIFKLPQEAETLREVTLVLGSSELSGKLENDRALAVQTAKSVGLDVPSYEEFSGPGAWNKAESYLRETGDKIFQNGVVWKPNGEAPASTFVAGDVDQMVHMLSYWKELYKEHKETPNFILTSKIEGQEISTEGWFNGKEFYVPNNTLERTRFFDGDHGEKTGCAGNVVWHNDGPLFKTLIQPLKQILNGRYCGPIDVNAIIDEKSNKPIFLEFTPRFGYDALFALIQGLDSDLGELFYQVAAGQKVNFSIRNDFAAAIRVHIPPYPEPPASDDKLRPVGIPIGGIPKNFNIGPYFPVEVYVSDDTLFTSGPDGYVIVIGGNGKSPDGAFEKVYKTIEGLDIPLMRYRLDLGKKLQEVYGKLLKTGWLEGNRSFAGR
jgi:phosphoribosylamine---glycine ligase